jgi:hypothetical protein
MTRSLRVVLVTLILATALAACGNAGDGGDRSDARTAAATTSTPPQRIPTPPANDVTRAKRALVSLADMPQEWSEQAGNVTRLRCGSFEPFRGSSALVRSQRLTLDHAGVQERIALYPTASAARRALARLDSDRATECLRRELRRHVSEEAGAPAGPATLVRVDRLGPRAHATRYTSTSINQYGKVIGYIDAVHTLQGRALGALVFVTGPARPDEELYDDVVGLVLRRLRTTLG